MPQMSPLNWLLLMMSFWFLFLSIYMLNYYLFYSSNLNHNKTNKNIYNNWKW
uniref:ATP synthase F0 subunit 8 n=1 Tax=Ophrygonius sp. TaxID=2897803 RepID=UPI001EDF299B|nr:ATP synthase F0 subunit 8 [Ophrygonius sp.]UFK32139.1 ATP synthase F0 subunit 8 [Ophrygonius sp.]UIN24734.1 ATP synthase F0 subunit 8 [Ophrygonius sp.]